MNRVMTEDLKLIVMNMGPKNPFKRKKRHDYPPNLIIINNLSRSDPIIASFIIRSLQLAIVLSHLRPHFI